MKKSLLLSCVIASGSVLPCFGMLVDTASYKFVQTIISTEPVMWPSKTFGKFNAFEHLVEENASENCFKIKGLNAQYKTQFLQSLNQTIKQLKGASPEQKELVEIDALPFKEIFTIDLNAKLKDFEQSQKQSEEEKAKKNKEICNLQNQIRILEEKGKSMPESQTTDEEIKILKTQVQEFEKQKALWEKQTLTIKITESSESQLQGSNSSTEEIDKIQQELETLKKAKEELEQLKKKHAETVASLEKVRANTQETLNQMRKETDKAEKVMKINKELQTRVSQDDAEKEAEKRLLNKHQDLLIEIYPSLNTDKTNFVAKMAMVLTNIEKRIAEHTKAIESLNKQLTDEQNNKAQLQEKIDEQEKLLSETQLLAEDLKQKLENSEQAKNLLETTNKSLLEQIDQEIIKFNQAIASNDGNKLQLEDLEHQVAESKKLCNSGQTKIHELSTQIETHKATISQLKEQLEAAHKDSAEKTEIETLESQLKDSQSNLENLKTLLKKTQNEAKQKQELLEVSQKQYIEATEGKLQLENASQNLLAQYKEILQEHKNNIDLNEFNIIDETKVINETTVIAGVKLLVFKIGALRGKIESLEKAPESSMNEQQISELKKQLDGIKELYTGLTNDSALKKVLGDDFSTKSPQEKTSAIIKTLKSIFDVPKLEQPKQVTPTIQNVSWGFWGILNGWQIPGIALGATATYALSTASQWAPRLTTLMAKYTPSVAKTGFSTFWLGITSKWRGQ